MHPDIEFFLEEAFDQIEPSVPGVGRVVVEPDYEADPDPAEKDKLCSELVHFVQDHPQSGQLDVPVGLAVLAKYVRRVTLKRDAIGGPWVEVAPPGHWI